MATLHKGKVKGWQPTPKQRALARAVVENLGSKTVKSTKAVLRSVGYSEVQSRNPQQVIQSDGFIKALADLGLTKELAVSALVEDIQLKPQRRAFELSIAGKWLGLEQRDKQPETQNMAINNAIIIVQSPGKLDSSTH